MVDYETERVRIGEQVLVPPCKRGLLMGAVAGLAERQVDALPSPSLSCLPAPPHRLSFLVPKLSRGRGLGGNTARLVVQTLHRNSWEI